MDKLAVCCALLVCLCQISTSVKIIDLKVPEALQSGSAQNVVLDCEFEVDEQDKEDGGLMVKWFYGDDTNMVYQWLPGNSPQANGLLRGRLDLEYKASKDKNTMHRALKIQKLSPSLTGSYTCKVSSFANEDVASKTMIIYKTADEGPFMEHSEENQIVNCTAAGMYPTPDMKLYIKGSNNTDAFNITTVVEQDDETGNFNITKTFYYKESDLLYPTEFTCEVFIPGTDYIEQDAITFYPGGEPTTPQPTVETIGYDFTTNTTKIPSSANFGITVHPNSIVTTAIVLFNLLLFLK